MRHAGKLATLQPRSLIAIQRFESSAQFEYRFPIEHRVVRSLQEQQRGTMSRDIGDVHGCVGLVSQFARRG